MEFSPNIVRCVLPLVAGYLGTIGLPEATRAQCSNIEPVGFNGVQAVGGKPFQAREITKIVTYGGDGTKHTQVVKAHLFRDSKGRVRVERFMDGTEDPSEAVPTDILVYDNCGTSFSLIPSKHTGKITTMSFPAKGPSGPFCKEIDPGNSPNPGPQGKFENLGHKFVDGIEIWGERTSFYASVEAKLSGAAPIQITEDWCSKVLDTPMVNYVLSDQSKREMRAEVSEVRQMEPDPELFEIPEGYEIIKDDRTAHKPNKQLGSSRPIPSRIYDWRKPEQR